MKMKNTNIEVFISYNKGVVTGAIIGYFSQSPEINWVLIIFLAFAIEVVAVVLNKLAKLVKFDSYNKTKEEQELTNVVEIEAKNMVTYLKETK